VCPSSATEVNGTPLDIDICPQVGGTLTKVCVTEGQRVKNGQTLFIIDQVPYEAAWQTAVANVEAA